MTADNQDLRESDFPTPSQNLVDEAAGTAKKSPTAEFEAIKAIYQELSRLEPESQTRVLNYLVDLLDISVQSKSGRSIDADEGDLAAADAAAADATTFESFAELYDAAEPATQQDKALVAGYWLQVCEGKDTFTSQAANDLLNNLGHKVANITLAYTGLQQTKPAFVLQVSKSGKSRQARKTLKLSRAGVVRVETMIGG